MTSLSFSVSGDFITSYARERLYENNDLCGAVHLLLGSLQTDEISLGDRILLAIEILEGKKAITGVYPSDNYRVEDVSTDSIHSIQEWQNKLLEKLKVQQTLIQEFQDKLCCIGEAISHSALRDINYSWRNDYDHDEDLFEDPWETSSNLDNVSTDETLNHFSQDEDTEDYGWLDTSGIFYPVDWGHHAEFAYMQLVASKDISVDTAYEKAEDMLIDRGWVLLHSPGLGDAVVSDNKNIRKTKAQREFLFNYFTDRCKPSLAKKYLDDE